MSGDTKRVTIGGLDWPEGGVPGLGSNCDGKIRGVILHYSVGDETGRWYDVTVLFKELLAKLDPDVRVIIVTGDDEFSRALPAKLGEAGEGVLPDGTPRVTYFPQNVSSRKLYPYARDPYMTIVERDGTLSMLDTGLGRRPFPITRWGEVIAGASAISGLVPLGGGNLRSSDDLIVIGIDSVLGTPVSTIEAKTLMNIAEAKRLPPDEMERRLDSTVNVIHRLLGLGKRLVVQGRDVFLENYGGGSLKARTTAGQFRLWDTGNQASYHTDVHLALGHKDPDGTRVAFCADTSLGAAAVASLSAGERREAERSLHHRLVEEGFVMAGVRLPLELIRERFKWDDSRAIDLSVRRAVQSAVRFERSIEELEQNGFRVVRVPFLPNGLNPARDDDAFDAVGVSFNYTNLVVEVYHRDGREVRKVYLPQFGVDPIDAAAAAPFRAEGYEVVQLRGLLTPALNSFGTAIGLNCLTSEVRVPMPSPAAK